MTRQVCPNTVTCRKTSAVLITQGVMLRLSVCLSGFGAPPSELHVKGEMVAAVEEDEDDDDDDGRRVTCAADEETK